VPWIAVAALAAVAWVVTVMLARDMGNGPGTMGLALLPSLGLWVVMMAAMMLPFRAALRVIDAEVTRRTAAARLPAAA
jgi:predicted metal-binding membrane protein